MSFKEFNLTNPLLNALDELGFTEPTAIQEKAFSVIMSGRDAIGIAQTGTGKTIAYLLPCLRQWTFSKDRSPQILILVPTRELVTQVVEQVQKLTAYMDVAAVGVYGGVNIKVHIAMVNEKVDVLVATPGRLIDLVLNGALKLKSVKKFIIDEVDEMLNLGFRHQLITILDLLPPKRQNLLFSATMTHDVEALIQTYFNGPVKIEAAPTGSPLKNIDQELYKVPNHNTKINLLKMLLRNESEMRKVLIFVATKQMADDLYPILQEAFPDDVAVIHSNKSQNARFSTVKEFQDGVCRLLIATDIIARGLDVSEVTHIINFDVPEIAEDYIHRIGRTGRADKKGISITFVSEREKENLEKIQFLMNYEIPQKNLPEGLEVSTVLSEYEETKIYMKTIQVKKPNTETRGAAFHEKSDKNKKVNNKIRKAERMKLKYGKPKTRGQRK
jgi:ATP-dependent RNA helicase RhlE